MICLHEKKAKYEGAKIHGLLCYEGKTYVRLIITNLTVLNNGFVEFDSVCQGIHEFYNDVYLTTPVSVKQTIQKAHYKQIRTGQFARIKLDDDRNLFVQIVGVNNFDWNGVDFEYCYFANLIQPLSKEEVDKLVKEKQQVELLGKYVHTNDPKVVKLVL